LAKTFLKPVTVSSTCGGAANPTSIVFTGYNYSTFAELAASSSFVSVNASTGDITVSATAPAGTFKIQMVAAVNSIYKKGLTVTLTGTQNRQPYLESNFSLTYTISLN
jgi:hypothetical protein